MKQTSEDRIKHELSVAIAKGKALTGYEINPDELVDIRTVSVDKNLPKQERIAEYVRQIKNPYLYKCGEFTIIEKHTEGGPSFEDCLRRLMS